MGPKFSPLNTNFIYINPGIDGKASLRKLASYKKVSDRPPQKKTKVSVFTPLLTNNSKSKVAHRQIKKRKGRKISKKRKNYNFRNEDHSKRAVLKDGKVPNTGKDVLTQAPFKSKNYTQLLVGNKSMLGNNKKDNNFNRTENQHKINNTTRSQIIYEWQLFDRSKLPGRESSKSHEYSMNSLKMNKTNSILVLDAQKEKSNASKETNANRNMSLNWSDITTRNPLVINKLELDGTKTAASKVEKDAEEHSAPEEKQKNYSDSMNQSKLTTGNPSNSHHFEINSTKPNQTTAMMSKNTNKGRPNNSEEIKTNDSHSLIQSETATKKLSGIPSRLGSNLGTHKLSFKNIPSMTRVTKSEYPSNSNLEQSIMTKFINVPAIGTLQVQIGIVHGLKINNSSKYGAASLRTKDKNYHNASEVEIQTKPNGAATPTSELSQPLRKIFMKPRYRPSTPNYSQTKKENKKKEQIAVYYQEAEKFMKSINGEPESAPLLSIPGIRLLDPSVPVRVVGTKPKHSGSMLFL